MKWQTEGNVHRAGARGWCDLPSCVEVAPYQSGEELFLDVSQIIPTLKTADYMIQLPEKTASDDHAAGAEAARHRRRRAYWSLLIEVAEKAGKTAIAGRKAGKDNWMTVTTGIRGVHFSLAINSDKAMVQLNFETPEKALNKAMFDRVQEKDSVLQDVLGDDIQWRRQEAYISSRLVISKGCDGLDRAACPDIARWHLDTLDRFEQATAPFMAELGELAKSA